MMELIARHQVPAGTHKTRASDYLIGVFSLLDTRSAVRKALKRSQITVDHEKITSAHWIEAGQIIELWGAEFAELPSFSVEIKVLFEDDHLAVVEKPPGIEVRSKASRNLENLLRGQLSNSPFRDSLNQPRAVHRLDYGTQGLLLIAKTKSALVYLSRSFENREIRKVYQAVVHGKLPEASGKWRGDIANQSAQSEYRVLGCFPSLKSGHLSLLELSPITGRTHQLRIHCSEAGFPIVGDLKYIADAKTVKGKGLFLAALELNFPHPQTGEILEFKLECPAKFRSLLDREERWFLRQGKP